MTTLAQTDARIARMAQLEDLFRMDPDLLEDYLDQERAHWDYVTNVELIRTESRAEGLATGRAEGREEALFATARRMLDDGMLPEQVARLTVLPIEEVMAMRK